MEKKEEKEKPSLQDDDGAEDGGAVAMDDTVLSSSPSWWWLSFTDAHPCSLLRHVVRACAGCLLGLCGEASDDRGDGRTGKDDKEDAAGDDPAATSQRDAEGGSKATHDWVGASLRTRRSPPGRPGDPRQGRGGSHN